MEKRRKIKHYNIPYHAHELTFSCYHEYDFFEDSQVCGIFMEELEDAKNKYNWAYILMPDHVHILLLHEKEKYNISRILQYAINYIEANSVRADYVKKPEDLLWSSASARMMDTGLVPDYFNVPFLMK